MFSLRDIAVYLVFPVLNFIIWFKLGQKSVILEAQDSCLTAKADTSVRSLIPASTDRFMTIQENKKPPRKKPGNAFIEFEPPELTPVDSKEFSSYSEEALVEMFFPGTSKTLLVNHHDEPCTSYINPVTAIKQECLAVAITDSKSSSLDLRFNAMHKAGPVVINGISSYMIDSDLLSAALVCSYFSSIL